MGRRRKIPRPQRHPGLQAQSRHDEAQVVAVLSIPRGRERDLRVIELEDGALALYMELFYIPGEPETYRASTRGYWKYIDSQPEIYEPDGTPKWRRYLTTGPKDSEEAE